MGIQKISSGQIKADSVNGVIIKDSSITSSDVALGTLLGTNIAPLTITGSNLANATITGAKIVNSTITMDKLIMVTNSIPGDYLLNGTILNTKISPSTILGSSIATNTITSSNILDETIINGDISATAAIDTIKIDWTTLTQTEAVQQVIKQPEGIIFQNYDLKNATTYVNVPTTTTSLIQHFYLNYPMTVNYLTYILTSGGSSYKTRVVIWNQNYVRIWDSGDQSAAAGTYKINVPALYLLPGVYYIAFMSSNTGTRFLAQAAPAYAVITQYGTLTFTPWGNWANPLVPTKITTSATKQPWFVISKY